MAESEQDIPSGLTPEASQASRDFRAKYEQMLASVRTVSLNVLVWGPSPMAQSFDAAKVARKRVDIRDKLIGLGHNAMFSENIPELEASVGLSEKSKEFAQARAADAICVLVESSPGALAEAHDFCNHPEIASKIHVMVPNIYRSGYSARGALKDLDEGYGSVYWYDQEEIDRCSVMGVAIKRVEARRNIRLRHGISPL